MVEVDLAMGRGDFFKAPRLYSARACMFVCLVLLEHLRVRGCVLCWLYLIGAVPTPNKALASMTPISAG